MKKYFVVADVHSFYKIMLDTLNVKGFDVNNNEHYLILCGDLFDRGNESKELFEFVQSLGDRFIYVRGNHEDLLIDCVDELSKGKVPSQHHFSNGTVKTICDFADENTYAVYWHDTKKKLLEKIQPVIDFINKKSVDYYEVDNYMFVHGWFPLCLDWSEAAWEKARWMNGMEAWKKGEVLKGKTVVCGHWHCSWGWSHIDQARPEFPPKNRKDWEKSFEPYIKEGIIALDACTAYSGICNCIVIEEGKVN
ncbi:metallophosphoesterase [Intestinibacter sp.]|uniref:metallophosphoesterase n=1 Tax=Intestinibacter sp. TaxID=1965304 RepID=UPI002A75EB62|nr:metallophosphoesterase [Intestinibacter sp.]MDY2735892.1 metallophosphoesterase [Intestinibacter sp.]